jgi:hypothetical protein
MASDSQEVAVLFGGEGAGGVLLSDTWEFIFSTSLWRPVEVPCVLVLDMRVWLAHACVVCRLRGVWMYVCVP